MKRFTMDKAIWQYDTVLEYCKKNNKKIDDKTLFRYSANHIGLFVTWLIENDLLKNSEFLSDFESIKKHKMTGTDFLEKRFDYTLVKEDIKPEVLEFMSDYYENRYLSDYGKVIGDRIFETDFSWNDYVLIKEMIDKEFKKYVNRMELSCISVFAIAGLFILGSIGYGINFLIENDFSMLIISFILIFVMIGLINGAISKMKFVRELKKKGIENNIK